jgi:hypothetical protein
MVRAGQLKILRMEMFHMLLKQAIGGECELTHLTLDPALQVLSFYVVHHIGRFLHDRKGLNYRVKDFKRHNGTVCPNSTDN